MLIYKKNPGNPEQRMTTPIDEYLGSTLEDLRIGFVMHGDPDPKSIHSWFIDELQERIVGLAVEGKLEEIQELVAHKSNPNEYLSSVRYCRDGFSSQKYEPTREGPYDGYSLLNIAMFHANRDMIGFLIDSCGMNPANECYANPIWTAMLPTDAQHTETGSEKLPLVKERFQILKEMVEDGRIEILGHESGKIKDTVFHITARSSDHELRGDMLSFFAEKVPGDMSKRNERVRSTETPINILCRNASFRYTHNTTATASELEVGAFARDLNIFKDLADYSNYSRDPEYTKHITSLPQDLKVVMENTFAPRSVLRDPSSASAIREAKGTGIV